jgi:hypothetical protein
VTIALACVFSAYFLEYILFFNSSFSFNLLGIFVVVCEQFIATFTSRETLCAI